MIARPAIVMPPEGLGSAGKVLRTNAGATAREWNTRRDGFNLRDGTIFQTFDLAGPRALLSTLTAGTIYLHSIPLRLGDIVTSLGLIITTGAVAPTNWWYVLCNSARVVLAVTADQLTAATGTGEVSLNLGTPYTVTADGQYYAGFMFAAGTHPVILRGNNAATESLATARSPILWGTSDAGQTTPPAVSATLGAITAVNGASANAWIRGK